VLIDGSVLTDDALDVWRWNAAWAAQRPALVHGTVGSNIALGRLATTKAQIEDAARRAGADAFITDLPDGYETVIGGGGRGVSAGQRQRIGLARAFLRRAPLVVLDEPTAYLDASSAHTVIESIRALRGSCTLVVLTHDMDLASRADRIAWIDAGRLRAGVGGAPDDAGGRR